jgi:hypothetical protein
MYTAYDAIEYLLSSTGGGAQDQEHRVLRQGLFHAYRDLINIREWKWYHTMEQVPLVSTDLIKTIRLPWGVSSVDAVYIPQLRIVAEYVSQSDWSRIETSPFQQLVRLAWTVMPSPEREGYYDLKLYNGYRYNEDVTLTYRRRPRDLRLTGWEPSSRAGTVTLTTSTPPNPLPGTYFTVAGTGTSFNSRMVGSVLRVSGDAAYSPEGLTGMHPYLTEGYISAVSSATAMTIHCPEVSSAYAGSKYLVTDLLDIAPSMYTALLSGAEVWVSRLLGKNIEAATAIHARDLRLAFEQDTLAPISGRRLTTGGYFSFWYLRPGLDQGVQNP